MLENIFKNMVDKCKTCSNYTKIYSIYRSCMKICQTAKNGLKSVSVGMQNEIIKQNEKQQEYAGK